METLYFLINGIIIGFVASIPLGPIGVICIQRTLCKSRRSGFISGLGAACADTIFAILAAFFLGVVLTFVQKHIDLIKVIGGICVIIVGVTIFSKNVVVQIRRSRSNKGSLWTDYLSVFFITMTNPALILMFMALFASFGISSDGMNRMNSSWLIAGVLIGASLWWLLLTFIVSLLRGRFQPRHLLYINRISGSLIVLLGTAAILSLFLQSSVERFIP